MNFSNVKSRRRQAGLPKSSAGNDEGNAYASQYSHRHELSLKTILHVARQTGISRTVNQRET
jgi:hypothetical protein